MPSLLVCAGEGDKRRDQGREEDNEKEHECAHS